MPPSKELLVSDENISQIAKALASKTRWQILKILKNKKLDVSQIAELLHQTEANISAQIKILELAHLITSRYEPGAHGVKKVCFPSVEKLIIKIM
ncbi:MAG: ArsR/SmtB family transcription factor [Candidatus Helarchaeota archaeon]